MNTPTRWDINIATKFFPRGYANLKLDWWRNPSRHKFYVIDASYLNEPEFAFNERN